MIRLHFRTHVVLGKIQNAWNVKLYEKLFVRKEYIYVRGHIVLWLQTYMLWITYGDLHIVYLHIQTIWQKKQNSILYSVSASLSSNIPSTISCSSIFLELLCIARYALKRKGFIPRTSQFFSRMIAQGGNSKITQIVLNDRGVI